METRTDHFLGAVALSGGCSILFPRVSTGNGTRHDTREALRQVVWPRLAETSSNSARRPDCLELNTIHLSNLILSNLI